MASVVDLPVRGALRVVLVGTGTGVGKTHVACALLALWSTRFRVVGLKPVETGVTVGGRRASRRAELSDQERLTGAAALFHVKHPSSQRRLTGTEATSSDAGGGRTAANEHARSRSGAEGAARTGTAHYRSAPEEREADAGAGNPRAAANRLFHVKRRSPQSPAHDLEPHTRSGTHRHQPRQSLFAFPEPISPHIAARAAGVRIDLGLIDRWVRSYEAPITVIETAGGLFSPLGHGSTNFELTQALHPHVVLLVAPDRLGVLHDLTTTLALAAARGGPQVGVVLSTPEVTDASTGRNAAEIEALGVASPIAVFPRADRDSAGTIEAARLVIAWTERLAGQSSRGNPSAEATSSSGPFAWPSSDPIHPASDSAPPRRRPRSR